MRDVLACCSRNMSVNAVELESCQRAYLWCRRVVGAPLAGSAGVVQHLLQAGEDTAHSQSSSPLLKAGGTVSSKTIHTARELAAKPRANGTCKASQSVCQPVSESVSQSGSTSAAEEVQQRTWVPSLVRCQSSFTRSAALRVRSFVSSTTPRTCSAADLELNASGTHQTSSSTPQTLTSAPQASSSCVRQALMRLRLPGVPHSLQPNPVLKTA